MKITAKATAVEFTVTGSNNEVLFSHKAENVETTGDLAALLTNVSSLAHLFKQLDASHNVRSEWPAPKAAPSEQQKLDQLIDAFHVVNTYIVDEALETTPWIDATLYEAREAARVVTLTSGLHAFEAELSVLCGQLRRVFVKDDKLMALVDALRDARLECKR